MRQRSLVDYLSQEIIDIILDNFRLEPKRLWEWDKQYHDHNLGVLTACSVVCRAFTPRCQYHLFATIHLKSLDRADERRRREGIYNMLLAKPHVSSGVRHVSLAMYEKGIQSVVTHEDLILPGLLLFLRERELTSIQLANDFYDPFAQSFPNPEGIEKHFLRPFIQISSITSLDIAFMVINASLLACFPRLTKLALYYSTFERSVDYKNISAPQPRPRLETLCISSNSVEEILRVCGPDAFPLFDLSQLRVFQTSGDRDMLMLNRAFDICVESLKELDVSGQYGAGPFYDPSMFCRTCSLAPFPRLAVLSLLAPFTLDEDFTTNVDPFVDCCRLMATIPLQNTMEKVAITLKIQAIGTLSPLCCLDVPGWDVLDDRFTLMADGKALEINMIIKWTATRRVADWMEAPSEEDLQEYVWPILQTALVPAIRKKLQRVGQSSNIVFNIAIDSCTVDTVKRVPPINPA